MSHPDTLQALLANLRPRSQASTPNHENTRSSPMVISRDVSMSNPSASAAHTTPPPFSPTLTAGNAAPNNATAQNLLNLLNFGNSAAGIQPTRSTSISGSQRSAGRTNQENTTTSTYTAADLLRRAAPASTSSESAQVPNPQSAKPAVEQPQQEGSSGMAPANNVHASTGNALDLSNPNTSQAQTSSPQAEAPKKPLFTYQNPFEALRASRPRTPRAHQQPSVAAPQQQETPREEVPVQSVEDPGMQQVFNNALSDRVKLTPRSRTSRQGTPAQSGGDDLAMETTAEHQPRQEQAQQEQSSNTQQSAEGEATEIQESTMETQEQENPEVHETGNGQVSKDGFGSRVVPVMSFPVKAFVSITLQLKSPASSRVREDGVMEISRMKKEFDQIDRSLAAASPKYITYALVNKGGMRIIRQDDGKDRHIFKHTHDRIFNVAVCTTSLTVPPRDLQVALGTGISGAVYYTTICKPDVDYFDTNNLDAESLIFPAFPQADENTAGGVLKTRAKRSSKHPEFFAIGRGKSINIVWPSTVMNSSFGVVDGQRKVDVEKLFTERPLQILTGKAGKDFNFSEDDTMIVSLDKTGRLRFWDIRKLVDEENAHSVQITPYIIDTPLLTLATASPTEKSWPTSVHFIDKARPYLKGGALRYVLVGLRQNHTLQLWDIALGKAVQEINFPHESETDGICSVTYHPASGIIVVGHPTRNSMFFIHLSAPRYVLSSTLTQATFVQRVAVKDPDIPKPESTAFMSGIREISFEGHGQLRSVELLPVYKQADNAQAENSDALFELYVAHSNGVTCLVINKEDLGWDADSKTIQSINAEEEGLIALKELKLGSVIEENTRSKSPVPESIPATRHDDKKKSKKAKKHKDPAEETLNGAQDRQAEFAKEVDTLSQENGQPHQEPASTEATAVEQPPVKESKKDRKKKAQQVAETVSPSKPENVRQTDSALAFAEAVSTNASQAMSSHAQPEQLSMSISGDWLDREMKKLEQGITAQFKGELDMLHQNIKADRAAQEQASATRQEAVLRIVSSTLNTNVEKTLSNIVRGQMQEVVVPSVVQTVSANLSQEITQIVTQTVKKELGTEIPAQLDRTLQSPQMLTRIADDVSTRVGGQIQQAIGNAISSTIAVSMKNIASSTATEAVAAAETRMADQVAHMSRQHAAFNEKIEQLNTALQSVTSTLQSMMQAQAAFQTQVMQDLRQPQPKEAPRQAQQTSQPPSAHAASATFSPAPSVRAIPARQKSKSDLEIDEIAAMMEQRKYEEGSIKWLQSSQSAKLFDDLFVRYTPDYLATDVSPLVAFSIGVTVANSMSVNTQRRLEWIDAAFDTVDFHVSSSLNF